MEGIAMDLNSNVTIKCVDKYNRVTRISQIHNKATSTMVEGILRFLQGDFNPTSLNTSRDSLTPEESYLYTPTHLRFGNIGVKMVNRNTYKPLLSVIEGSEYTIPTFEDLKLQADITENFEKITGEKLRFDSVELATFNDVNSSMGLLIKAYLPLGKMVGIGSKEDRKYFTDTTLKEYFPYEDDDKIRGWVYYNPSTDEYEAMFTEIGLYSEEDRLLARVLFDGATSVDESGKIIYDIDNDPSNPIVQSDTSSLIVEWRIGIVAIGPNDDVVSAVNPIPNVDPIESEGGEGSLLSNTIADIFTEVEFTYIEVDTSDPEFRFDYDVDYFIKVSDTEYVLVPYEDLDIDSKVPYWVRLPGDTDSHDELGYRLTGIPSEGKLLRVVLNSTVLNSNDYSINYGYVRTDDTVLDRSKKYYYDDAVAKQIKEVSESALTDNVNPSERGWKEYKCFIKLTSGLIKSGQMLYVKYKID